MIPAHESACELSFHHGKGVSCTCRKEHRRAHAAAKPEERVVQVRKRRTLPCPTCGSRRKKQLPFEQGVNRPEYKCEKCGSVHTHAEAKVKRCGSDEVRARVWDRDRATCVYCGDPATHLDHVIPHSRCGPPTEKNLVCACNECGTKKGNKTPREAGMAFRAPRGMTGDSNKESAMKSRSQVVGETTIKQSAEDARETKKLADAVDESNKAGDAKARAADKLGGPNVFPSGDEGEEVTVTVGIKNYQPRQFNQLQTGPFTTTTRVRSGETRTDAALRAYDDLARLEEKVFDHALKAFKANFAKIKGDE